MTANLTLLMIFIIIIACVLWKFDLTIGLLVAGTLIGMIMGGMEGLFRYFRLTIFDVSNLTIIVDIYLIQILRHLVSSTGIMKNTAKDLNSLVRNYRTTLMMMPVLFSVIPGSGATLLSAAVVEEYSGSLGLRPTAKAYINFWFRSAVQFASPITFAFITITRIVPVEPSSLVLAFLPVSIIMFLSGYFVEMRHLPLEPVPSSTEGDTRTKKALYEFLKNTGFVWLILCFYLILRMPLFYGLIGALILIVIHKRVKPGDFVSAMRKGLSWNLFGLIMAVFFLQLVVTETQLVPKALAVWQGMGINDFVLAEVFSLLIGLSIGTYVAALALSFSLFGGLATDMYHIILIYAITRIGCYISPVNSALLLNAEFFKTNFRGVAPKLAKSLVPVIAYLVFLMIVKSSLK